MDSVMESNSTSIDLISNIPKELQSKILSYLPFKEAAATSILSKSWRPVWSLRLSHHPSLSLDDRAQCPDSSTFQQLVDAHLDESRLIGRLHLRSTSSATVLDHYDFGRWIDTAVQCEVEILDLSAVRRDGGESKIPLVMTLDFASESMVVLRLEGISVMNYDIGCVRLPSLKILHFVDVRVQNGYCLSKFLRGSQTSLEDLVLHGVRATDTIGECICRCSRFPKLMSVDICSYFSFKRPSIGAFYNVESLKISPVTCEDPDNPFKTSKMEFWSEPHNFHRCVSSQLRRCYLRGIYSDEDKARVVPFAKYILENGEVLETMTILCNNSHEKQIWMDQLVSHPRSSPTCELKLEVLEVHES
ncbi:F-box/FBD/LRR-repeat protein [Senna tora]|uniref:F-box/FBD/LRR-repeat protein n=1 Tax=Senna tora TaxID=362788 RepID=A0A834SMR0_9FABA|nr:F-box/FBD/LRR-repeat protein [Senna tora]